jgi:hypothetical protein
MRVAGLGTGMSRPIFTRPMLAGSVVHEEVDVLGEAAGPVSHDGKAADQQIPCACCVQRTTDADDVVRLRRPCCSAIILIIHASASSNEENRYTPLGTRPAWPRRNAAVRVSRP